MVIATFSRDKNGLPLEVTDGLRVLGIPIGSHQFCTDFILKAMGKAAADCKSLLNGLEDYQTIFQLFKTCTIHKLTYLFPPMSSQPIVTIFLTIGWVGRVTSPFVSLIWLKTCSHLSWPRHPFHITHISSPPWVLHKVDLAYYIQLHQQSLLSC